MTIKYANGWWGIYGADPYHVPKFKKFIDAIRWAKKWRGLEVPRLRHDYQTVLPNRLHILVMPEWHGTGIAYLVYRGTHGFGIQYATLAEAVDAAHTHAATTR